MADHDSVLREHTNGDRPPGRPSLPIGHLSRAGGMRTIKTDNGWRYLHIHVYEEHLGRKLHLWEHVRWKSDDRDDCTLDNLELYDELVDRDPEMAAAIKAYRQATAQRRPRKPYPRTPRVQAQLGEDLHAFLSNLAAAQGKTLACYCTEALLAHALMEGLGEDEELHQEKAGEPSGDERPIPGAGHDPHDGGEEQAHERGDDQDEFARGENGKHADTVPPDVRTEPR